MKKKGFQRRQICISGVTGNRVALYKEQVEFLGRCIAQERPDQSTERVLEIHETQTEINVNKTSYTGNMVIRVDRKLRLPGLFELLLRNELEEEKE